MHGLTADTAIRCMGTAVRKVLGTRAVICGIPPAYGLSVSHLLGLGCPFRDLTGVDCPGCGATRAFFSLLHGNLTGALHDNLAAVALGAVAGPYLFLAWLGWRLRHVSALRSLDGGDGGSSLAAPWHGRFSGISPLFPGSHLTARAGPGSCGADMEREISGRPGHLADVEIAVGRALDWHLAGWGRFAEGIPHVFASCEVDSIAGLGEIDTFGAVAIWEVLRQAALGVLSGAALMPGCDALELRYIAVPDPPGPSLIRMFITAKTRGYAPEVAVAAVAAACAALPRGFSHPGSADIRTSDPTRGLPVIELRRHEEVTIPQWDYVPADFYYTINDDPGDGSGWPAFWPVLSQVVGPVSISLLFSCTELDWDERNALAGITSDLNVVAFPHTDFDVLGQQVNYPADMNAKIALDSWTRRIAQLQRPLLARVAVRAEPEVGAPVAAALASTIAASAGPDTTALPMSVERPESARDVRQAAYGFDWLEVLRGEATRSGPLTAHRTSCAGCRTCSE